MNLLFLDIDGVLNSARSSLAGLNRDSKTLVDRIRNSIDPVSVGLIERLIMANTSLHIVISSSHRINFAKAPDGIILLKEYMLEITGSRLLATAISGATDCDPGSRGEQIKRYLDTVSLSTEPVNYAILDDINSMLPEQQANFVKTDPDIGISYDNYKQLLEILTGQPIPFYKL